MITSCLFVNNTTGDGGTGQNGIAGNGGNGVGIWNNGATVMNCTIVSNQLGSGGASTNISGVSGAGGGIWSSNGVVVHSILWNNASSEIAGSGFRISYSDVGGGMGQPWFDPANCLDADPQFTNPGLGDWHLAGTSFCINAGMNQSWMTNATDLDGNPRIAHGTVDMGALEFVGVIPPPRVWFTEIGGLQSGTNSGTNCWLQICAPPRVLCTLQASTNLVNWAYITTQTLGPSGLLEIIDQDAHRYPRRFYRASMQPGSASIPLPATSGVITPPFISISNYIYQTNETVLANGGRAVYDFTITNAGTYVIETVVNAAHEGANSFFLNIDAEPQDPYMVWDIPVTTGFEPRVVGWRGNGTWDNDEFVPKVFNLSPGSHQLILRGREANTRLQSLTVLPYPGN
jgi:hypothetical protein